jgi:hypothetical protein
MYGANVESAIQPLVDQPSRPPGPPSLFDGARHDTAIDIRSSGDEEELETMPELINGCNNCYNSSSDEDCYESVRSRPNPDYPPVPVPSFFDGGKCYNDADNCTKFSNTNPTFRTNCPYSFSKHKDRRRKKLRTSSQNDRLHQGDVPNSNIGVAIGKKQSTMSSNINPSDPPECHSAGSKIWSSSLCLKGICLIVQTESEVHVVQDCRPGIQKTSLALLLTNSS